MTTTTTMKVELNIAGEGIHTGFRTLTMARQPDGTWLAEDPSTPWGRLVISLGAAARTPEEIALERREEIAEKFSGIREETLAKLAALRSGATVEEALATTIEQPRSEAAPATVTWDGTTSAVTVAGVPLSDISYMPRPAIAATTSTEKPTKTLARTVARPVLKKSATSGRATASAHTARSGGGSASKRS